MPDTSYFIRFPNLRMSRDATGVLEVTMHSQGEPLVWDATAHRDLADAFYAIARDPVNKLVILTGSGERWITSPEAANLALLGKPSVWSHIYWEGKALLENLLAIDVPMIAAVNGPARVHSEIAVLCDIVLAADDSVFQDRHLEWGLVPGDGMHAVWTQLLGPNRGRHFLLTHQELTAAQARELGVVAEVLPRAELLPRAHALARNLLRANALSLRYTRACFTRPWKRLLADELSHGLALEGLSAAAVLERVQSAPKPPARSGS